MAGNRPMKLTVVGDGTVGKTCLLVSYTTNSFPTEYVPTVFDNYADTVVLDGVTYNLTLWDTAGQEEYERLRPISYPNTNVFLACYAVDNRTSFTHIEAKWIPELKHYCPDTPVVLVATKTDKRQSSHPGSCISTADGQKLAKKIRAAKFVECSALTGENLKKIFEDAVAAALQKNTKPKRPCILL